MNDDSPNSDATETKRSPRRKLRLSSSGAADGAAKGTAKRKKTKAPEQPRTQLPAEEVTSSAKETAEIYDPNLAKKSLRLYFLIILIAGSLIILFPFTTGLMNMVIASGLMSFYYFLGNKFAKYPNTRAVFGDSMYYLGFLFTFVALVAAMMNISEESEVDAIIAQMGPALITTVIGMAVRIYLTQFDAITTEPETEAMNSLGLLSANLIDALDALNKTSDQNRQAIETMQERSNAQMERFASRLSAIDTEGITRRFEDLANAIENLSLASAELKERAERSKVTTGDIEQSLNNLQGSADRVTTQLQNVQNFEADLSQLKERVTSTTESFQTFSERLENRVGNSASEINNSVVGLARDLSKTEEEIRNLASNLREAVTEVVDFLNRRG